MKLDEILNRILDSQEETQRDVSDMKADLAAQKVILDEHMRRSLANEEAVEIMRAQIKPIEEHILKFNFTFKLVAAVGTTLAVIAAVVKIIDFIIRHYP